jgi:hypothetical protein
MQGFCGASVRAALMPCLLAAAVCVCAQSGGSSGSINGTVLDPTGAVVPDATVEIHNPVSHYDRSTTSDTSGNFNFPNVPFNPYHMTISAQGFSKTAQDVEVRSVVPVNLQITLQASVGTTTVTVEAGGDLVENDSTFHNDVDRDAFEKIPEESPTSEVSGLVTQSTPGVSADSNGQVHGLGDHAENSFSVDGQPITDQQSKVFSNQIPLDSVQSLEVISGAPPAEYGGKTSVVVVATTRSGQGVTKPTGSITASYGTFGTSKLAADVAYGGKNWGNFISASGLQTGRFLDPPEFAVFHDKGNEENAFDRVDLQVSSADSLHLNFGYTRSWFQTPNSLDAEFASAWSGLDGVDAEDVNNYHGIGPNGLVVGPTDQRSKIGTFNVAPSWTHVISNTSVFTLGGFVRRDDYNYYPSGNPFADLGPPSLQRQSVVQNRTLLNAGIRSDISYVKNIHNIKAGITYDQTFLDENDRLGIVDPTYNAPCLAFSADQGIYVAAPAPGITNPSQCSGGLIPNTGPGSQLYPAFNPVLLPYDLTRGGSYFVFLGHTDVKELGVYVRDNITKGNWSVNVGLRGDVYNGLTVASQAEPRVGVAYDIKKTNTIIRMSYARTLESPFNENLILSSEGCNSPVLAPLLNCTPGATGALNPGFRNEFHAGLEQAFGKYVVFSGEWITKYTHNGYDFSVLGNTPITFPIEWHNSKIPGYAGRISMPEIHGISAQTIFSSVAARFFQPQIGGAGATVATAAGLPFRIDHDEKFNQATHLQYQPWKRAPWLGFNWRYDSGQVAGNAPCYGVSAFNDCPQSTTIPALSGAPAVLMQDSFGHPLSADQEFEAGFSCNGMRATPSVPLPTACLASQFRSSLISVPAPGTENDDHNPPRIGSRNLFDLSIGDDDLFHGEKYKWSAQLTVVNLANEYALYNFLSTFSGTHYVTPRTLTGEVGFHF